MGNFYQMWQYVVMEITPETHVSGVGDVGLMPPRPKVQARVSEFARKGKGGYNSALLNRGVAQSG